MCKYYIKTIIKFSLKILVSLGIFSCHHSLIYIKKIIFEYINTQI